MKQLSIAIIFVLFAFHSLYPAEDSFEEKQIAYVEIPDAQALPPCPLAFLNKPLSTWDRWSGRLGKTIARHPKSVNMPITYTHVYACNDDLDPNPSSDTHQLATATTRTLVDLKVGPLPLAVSHLSAKNFELLLKKGANPNLLKQKPTPFVSVRTPLAQIIDDETCRNPLAKCRLLCSYRANVEIGSFTGNNQEEIIHRSPLVSAIVLLMNQSTIEKGLACAAVLCSYGANKETARKELRQTTTLLNAGITFLGMLETQDFRERIERENRLRVTGRIK